MGEIDYKMLHQMLLERKKWLEEISTEDSSSAAEIQEIEIMMISIRNLYRRTLNKPINWEFGSKHPITKKRMYSA